MSVSQWTYGKPIDGIFYEWFMDFYGFEFIVKRVPVEDDLRKNGSLGWPERLPSNWTVT